MPIALAPAPTADSPLEKSVHNALQSSPYVAGARVRVEAGEGRVRLHGDVGTFFEKQMAQEVVRRIDGVQQVENLLQVAWT
ncbi:BON domain-containing protein [Botrimarina sp.]|uniref:BON domain-containing protein n=1 Tax=Botrimarina sp. TaxID=2795802 RepID=UPI0032F09A2C